MLSTLHIENIAVIERADIDFESGFQVLTGETGAGKSIIIDSISAILGERAYRDMIRTGETKGSVTALFIGVPELKWFEETGVPYEGDELLVQRDIFLDGRNQIRVNGRPVSVSLLKKLGGSLISIHGQHDSQQLFDEATHLSLLDAYAKNTDEYGAYIKEYETFCNISAELTELKMDEAEKERKIDILSHQIAEIDEAGLAEGEEDELAQKRALLQNAERISSCVDDIYAYLSGDENTDGADSLLYSADKEFSRISSFYDGLDALHSELTDIMYRLDDISDEIRNFRNRLDFSPSELDEVEERLALIKKLKRKYGGSVQEILAFRKRSSEELEKIESASDRVEKLLREKEKQGRVLLAVGQKLRENRKKSAEELRLQIEDELSQLDMPNARFSCRFEEKEPGQDGIDTVRFLMSANVGEDMKPLSKVASGGELARIMLAIKNVMADRDQIETLIFDEVDAGVSGRAAQKVAEKLKRLAKCKQVLCVTHLPQIAAAADTHFLISKAVVDGRTFTSVKELDPDGRTEEIARIIGGAVITDVTRKTAREMIFGT